MRTRMFLRTTEFLWQEGHTVHATENDAREMTARMLGVYADFAEQYLAMPVICGEKTAAERFPGALATYSIEAMMQDRKALQSGTSHFLGQNFANASGIKFLDASGTEQTAWTTSWAFPTRLIGALIMTHSDDNGLIVPPRIAPMHVVILPVLHKEETRSAVLEACEKLKLELRSIKYQGRNLEAEVDTRDIRGGEKTWDWIKRGVPIRLEIGPRDIASDSVFMGRRDLEAKEKSSMPRALFLQDVCSILDEIQSALLQRARAFREAHTRRISDRNEFTSFFTPKTRRNRKFTAALPLRIGMATASWRNPSKRHERHHPLSAAWHAARAG